MIDAKRIEEMKRLSELAAKGPWWASWSYSDKPAEVNVNRAEGYSVSISAELEDEDAMFIAKSRQFVPDIIAAYEEQSEEVVRLRKALEEIRSTIHRDEESPIFLPYRSISEITKEALK